MCFPKTISIAFRLKNRKRIKELKKITITKELPEVDHSPNIFLTSKVKQSSSKQ